MPPSRRAILVLPEPPYPADCGNALRDVQQIELLARLGYETVLVCARPRLSGRRREDGRDVPDGVDVRFLAPQPLPERERRLHTIRRKVSYLRPRNAKYPFGWWLRFYDPGRHLPALMRDIQPALVVLRSVFLEYLPAIRNAASCPVVVDCHDDDLQLAAEMIRSVPVHRRAGPLANYVGTRQALGRLLPLADEIWAVSAQDARGLQRLAGGRPVLTVPSGVDEARVAPAAAPGRDGTCAMVANFDYGLNLAGARWFAGAVWPSILGRMPSAEFWLVGGGAADSLASLCDSYPGLRRFGRVADLDPIYRDAGVMIAPLLHGGGSRLKILEAWQHGKAVAGTTKGLEGLDAPLHSAVVADTPGRLAAGIGDLLVDQRSREVLASRGLEFVSSRYAWRAIASALRETSIVAQSSGEGSSSMTTVRSPEDARWAS